MAQHKATAISWPDVVFYAEAQCEPFADMQIITLYAHCLNQVEEQNIPLDRIKACEFIEVLPDRVVVVVDAETIDNEAVATALDMMTHIDTFEVGTYIEFPPKKSFSYKKLH